MMKCKVQIDWEHLMSVLSNFNYHYADYKKERRKALGNDSRILNLNNPRYLEAIRSCERMEAEGNMLWDMLCSFGFSSKGIRRLFSACKYEEKFMRMHGYQICLSREGQERLLAWAMEADD